MTSCPTCFQALPPVASTWCCFDQQCHAASDAEATAYLGIPVAGPPVIRRDPVPGVKSVEAPTCPHCGGPTMEVCPVCHVPLPDANLRDMSVTCIALAGPRSSGKTVYIAVLVKELARLATALRGDLRPMGAATQRTYAEVYEAFLSNARQLPAPTRPSSQVETYQRLPLIFHLGTIGKKQRIIALRDVAGEDLENRAVALPRDLDFFGHADGVLHLFDPFALDQVREKLHGLVADVGTVTSPVAPRHVLDALLRIVNARKGAPNYALVMSKFDTIQVLRRVQDPRWNQIMGNAGAGFSQEPPLESFAEIDGKGRLVFGPDTVDVVSAEVESLLLELGANDLVNALRNGAGTGLPRRFFCASALGEPADGGGASPRGISPFRVLDPVLWVLRTTWARA